MNAISFKRPVATTGDIRWYNGTQMRFLLEPEATEGDFAVLEITALAGTEPPAHVHLHEDETFMVQEGEIHFFIGEKVIEARPGTLVFAPRGIRHSFRIVSPAARFHLIITPGDFANYFREMSTDVPPSGPLEPSNPENFREVKKLLEQRYGVHFTQNSL